MHGETIGKIIIQTHFKGDVFKLPINILDRNNKKVNIDCQKKTLCVIYEKKKS